MATNVLAVMDIDTAPTYDTPQDWHNALREARAAVAGLMDAAGNIGTRGRAGTISAADFARLRTAVTNCGGAA